MAKLLMIKIFFNSVISINGTKLVIADTSNFYLMTPLRRPEFVRVKHEGIPEEIVRAYNLQAIATPDGWVYI